MINKHTVSDAKKTVSVICAASLALSATGCLNLFGLGKSTKNQEAVRDAIAEGNFVEEWDGDIPEGMEVDYVLVKEQRVNYNDNLYEFLYKYDEQGRVIYYCEATNNGYELYEKTYDDNGNIISKKQTHEGYVGSAGFPDIEFEYKYNEDGLLIYYKETQLYNDEVYEHFLEYDEEGHLISLKDGNGIIRQFEVNYEDVPYYESFAVISDEVEAKEPEYVTRYYNGGGYLISEQYDNYKMTYEYDNGEVVRSTREFVNSSAIYVFDAYGNNIDYSMGSGDNLEAGIFQYNEHHDLVFKEVTRGGALSSRASYTYEYDENGNMISKTSELTTVNSKGEEVYVVTMETYTYDEHGLLVTSEYKFDDGSFQALHVYYYKAILVPVK